MGHRKRSPGRLVTRSWWEDPGVTRRVCSPDLVDRSAQLGALADAWAQVVDGRPAVIVVRADAGLGKTRLMTTFEAVIVPGALVLHGGCVHGNGFASPLLPFVTAVGELVERWGLDRVGALARGSPTVLRSLLEPRTAAGESPVEAAYDVLVRVLDAASREEPVALLLEDLHWAAPETWALLDHLARAVRTGRLLVAATMRPDPGLPPAAIEVLHELVALPHVETLDLPPLTPSGVRNQLRGILGHPPAEDLAERTVERSGGIPLLVEELAAAEAAGERGVPGRMADLLAHRTRTLPEAARTMLHAAAIAAGPVDPDVLAGICGLDPHDAAAALSALRDADLLVGDPATGAVDFRHALLREAAEAQIPSAKLVLLHRRHAERLDAAAVDGRGDDPRAVLAAAHHWAHADDPREAWRATTAAVAVAAALGEHRTQWRLLSEQLVRYDTVAALGVPDLPARLTLLRRTAVAACWCGQFDAGGRLLDDAWRSLDLTGDAETALDVLGDLCRWVTGGAPVAPDVEDAVRTALDALPSGPGRARLRALLALLDFEIVRREFDAARRTLSDAVECALALGDEVVVARLRLESVFMFGSHDHDPDAGLRQFADTRTICQRHGDGHTVLWATMNEVDYLYLLGRYGDAEARAREAAALADELPASAVVREFVTGNLFEVLLATGGWAEARDRMLAHLEVDRPDYMRGVAYLLVAGLWLELGDLPAADQALAEGQVRARHGSDPQIPVLEATVAAEVALAHGYPDEALVLVRDAFLAHAHHVPRARSCLLLHTAARAAVRLASPDPQLTSWMLAGLDRMRCGTPPPVWWFDLLAAEIAVTDVVLWESATAALDRTQVPVLVGIQAAIGAARAALDRGLRSRAQQLLAEAVRDADRLGARRVRGEAEQLALRHRLPIHPVLNGAGGRVPSPRTGLEELTPREVEVLLQVAAGHSNGRIGVELAISVKTVSVHVSHILAKLDVSSRGEAAAKAWQHGVTFTAAQN
jgi:DNA-binding CsgD family transcriptional regulator